MLGYATRRDYGPPSHPNMEAVEEAISDVLWIMERKFPHLVRWGSSRWTTGLHPYLYIRATPRRRGMMSLKQMDLIREGDRRELFWNCKARKEPDDVLIIPPFES